MIDIVMAPHLALSCHLCLKYSKMNAQKNKNYSSKTVSEKPCTFNFWSDHWHSPPPCLPPATVNWTQGLILARQVLYYLSLALSPLSWFVFQIQSLANFTWAGQKPVSTTLGLPSSQNYRSESSCLVCHCVVLS
jgi:hypothetical protein